MGPAPEPNRIIDLQMDLDLGELIVGHHVVIKGIEITKRWGSALHNDFVPGFDPDDLELDKSWGLGQITDDVGTVYEHGGQGGWGPHPDGLVHWGDEHLGNTIPRDATLLTIEVHYADSPPPLGCWIRSFTVDLANGVVMEAVRG